MAQPSLSRAVRKLEEELGGDLFRRERGQSHLSDLGRSMLPFLRQSYEGALAAKEQAASYGAAEYAPLRLGLSLTVDLEVVAPMLSELARGYPGLQLHLIRASAEVVLEGLKAGEIELALAADNPAEWDRFDRWPLFEEGFVVVSSPDHPLTGEVLASAAGLAGHALIGRPYCESAAAFLTKLKAREIELKLGHEAANDADARTLASHGMGIGLLPRTAAGGERGTRLVDLELTRTLYAYGVAGRPRSAAASALLSLLRAADWPAVVDEPA